MSGHIQFLSQMNRSGKKPLLGCEFYICKENADVKNDRNRKLAHLCVIARNDQGWRDLVQMVSMANQKDHFYHKPRLSLKQIEPFAQKGNLMAFSGHLGSNMANVLFDEDGEISNHWKSEGTRLARWFSDTFGKDNFFLEVQLMDCVLNPTQKIVADCIREISKDTGIPCVATPDAHYARKEDAQDQRILLCSNMKTTIQQANRPEFGLGTFFKSNQYHIPSYEEMRQWHTAEELDNTNLFAARVEEYKNILRPPMLPNFPCPDGMNPEEYLRHLCREGWRQKIQNVVHKEKHADYVQ